MEDDPDFTDFASDPLFISDILHSEPKTAEARQEDVLNYQQLLREKGDQSSGYPEMSRGHQLLRDVGIVLVHDISFMDVGEALEIYDRLMFLDSQEAPLAADLYAVAVSFQENREETTDVNEQAQLDRLVIISYALADLPVAMFVHDVHGDSSPIYRRALETSKWSITELESAAVPENTRSVLGYIYKRLRYNLDDQSGSQ